MRLFLPERVPLVYAGLFASLLFVMEIFAHTGLYFASCSFLFILVAAFGFNITGGLTRPAGGYIFFFSLLAVIVGITAKTFLGEPADSRLQRPKLTITVYLVGMVTLAISAYLARRYALRRPLLAGALVEENLPAATLGCLFVGSVLTIGAYTVDRGSGSAWSALVQINRFTELSIILNVFDTLRRTGGRRSLTLPGYIATGVLFLIGGILGYSKESMLTPAVCWFFAACAVGLRLSRAQIIGGVIGMVFFSYYLVPYSQFGRTQQASTFFGNIEVAQNLLSRMDEVHDIYKASEQQAIEQGTGGYFSKPEGILDRLQMFGPDDLLIDATELHGPYGYYPILEDLEALVPHVFWPGKPTVLWGNVYAHQAGVDIPEDDFSTGISFSPVAEGYHLGGWTGVLVLCPLVWFSVLWVFESLCGDARIYPWSLLTVIYFSHAAPEGYLGGIIYAVFYFGIAIVFAAITIGYVMPVIGGIFTGHRGPMGFQNRVPPRSSPDELAL